MYRYIGRVEQAQQQPVWLELEPAACMCRFIFCKRQTSIKRVVISGCM